MAGGVGGMGAVGDCRSLGRRRSACIPLLAMAGRWVNGILRQSALGRMKQIAQDPTQSQEGVNHMWIQTVITSAWTCADRHRFFAQDRR